MSKFLKTVVIIVLTVTLGLGSLAATGGVYDAYKQTFGDAKWHVKLNAFIDAASAAYTELSGRISNISNLISNWASTVDSLALIQGTPTYSDDHTFSLPGDYTALLTANKRLVADCGADGLKPNTVVSSTYASPNTTVVVTTHNLSNNLAAVSYYATRNGNNVYGSGSVVAGDFGAPSQANLVAADAVAGRTREVVVTPGIWNISSDLTLSSPLKPMPGAVLTKNTGSTHLTINGPVEAGLYQWINDNSATHNWVVFGAGAVKKTPPEWFAVNATPAGSTDMTAAFQSCIHTSTTPIIDLTATKYRLTAPLNIDNLLSLTIQGPTPYPSAAATLNQLGSVVYVKEVIGDLLTTATNTLTDINLKNVMITGANSGFIGGPVDQSTTLDSILRTQYSLRVNIDGCVLGGLAKAGAKVINLGPSFFSRIANTRLIGASSGYLLNIDNGPNSIVSTTTTLDGVYFTYAQVDYKITDVRTIAFKDCVFETSVTAGIIDRCNVMIDSPYFENIGGGLAGNVLGIDAKRLGVNYGGILTDPIDTVMHMRWSDVIMVNPHISALASGTALVGYFRGIGYPAFTFAGGRLKVLGGTNTCTDDLFPPEANQWRFLFEVDSGHNGFDNPIVNKLTDLRRIDNGNVGHMGYYTAQAKSQYYNVSIKNKQCTFYYDADYALARLNAWSSGDQSQLSPVGGVIVSNGSPVTVNSTGITQGNWEVDDRIVMSPAYGAFQYYRNYVQSTVGAWLPEAYRETPVKVAPNGAYISTYDNGSTFTESGVTATILPPATVGLKFPFIRTANDFTIYPAPSTDLFSCGSGAGKYIRLDTNGASMTVKCNLAGVWDVIASHGTLTNE